MGELSRIGVAIDSDLLGRFDEYIAKRGYTNRSEAFRDMIREDLVEHASESPEARVIGTVTLVYGDLITGITVLPTMDWKTSALCGCSPESLPWFPQTALRR